MCVRVICPMCGTRLVAPPNSRGRKGPCPHCGSRVQIPGPERSQGEAWYYQKQLQTVGPVPFHTLVRLAARGEIGAHTRVRPVLDGTWRFAHEVPGLREPHAGSARNRGA